MRQNKGQAVIEIAIFGVILVFLIGVILRTHLSYSFGTNHQVRAMKLALQQSYKSSIQAAPNSSRNSSSVIFIEDRLTPDLNKFTTIDRTPFVANGSGTMSNRLQYPIDFGEVSHNIPVMDFFINGQHFPLTVAGYTFRVLYPPGVECPSDLLGPQNGPEYTKCLRQQNESSAGFPTFYTSAVNGTSSFNSSSGNFDLMRNNWDAQHRITPEGKSLLEDDVPPGTMRRYIAWQWQPVIGSGSSMDFGSGDQPNYPVMDATGSLREQTIYGVSYKPYQELVSAVGAFQQNRVNPSVSGAYVINLKDDQANGILGITRSKTASPITGVAVLDGQMGDIDTSYDSDSSPGPQPGLMPQMSIYTFVKPPDSSRPGTYLQIKEGKLYNPETNALVRSTSSRDNINLISRMIQLSNDTQRFCQGSFRPQYLADQSSGPASQMPNPVEACGDCSGANVNKTCFDPQTRILFVRTMIGDTTTRKWFTDVTKGL